MNTQKKNVQFLLIFLALALLPLINAQTISDTVITSIGLNTTINVTGFSITFDQLEVFNNAITIHNLTYIHPNNCNGLTSSQALFNYTTPNNLLTASQAFPATLCQNGGRLPSGGSSCNPIFSCVEWSFCNEGLKSKNCVDLKCSSRDRLEIDKCSKLDDILNRLSGLLEFGCIDFEAFDIILDKWKNNQNINFDSFDKSLNKWKMRQGC